MADTQQRFQMLAEQFAVLEHNLSVSQNAEQRAEVLKGMNTVIVIEELDQLILANQTWLDSKLASVAPTNKSPRACSTDSSRVGKPARHTSPSKCRTTR
jgi:hypothetical protein